MARDVRLLIKGQWFTAQPTVIKEPEQKADVLAEFVRRNGVQAAKGLMLGLPGDHRPDRQQLVEAGAKTTFIRFVLAPELRHRSQLLRTISSGLSGSSTRGELCVAGSRSRCSGKRSAAFRPEPAAGTLTTPTMTRFRLAVWRSVSERAFR